MEERESGDRSVVADPLCSAIAAPTSMATTAALTPGPSGAPLTTSCSAKTAFGMPTAAASYQLPKIATPTRIRIQTTVASRLR
ncbi:hypothetical protein F0562_017727 [Nyssa sinensis]|uniref:Uncharacterized protein n=1 Tax=Nyssa sinensis TaxID=561372 RepID=A0A5J4ZHR4_9ASTE|nr:hypothetical protein F0562_017727 [Nyssa sinensis]